MLGECHIHVAGFVLGKGGTKRDLPKRLCLRFAISIASQSRKKI